jgi:Cu-Zn family superoxide dismutase
MLSTRRFAHLLRVMACFALPAVALAPLVVPSPSANAGQTQARAILRNAAGEEIGWATFTQMDVHVVIEVEAYGLSPEFHGFHIHGTGACEAPDFVTAGGHFNTGALAHALHAGDLPSLLVSQDGNAQMRVTTDRFRVEDLLSGAGTAVIVHANRDNYTHIPTRYVPEPDSMTLATGDAGARLACGVVEVSEALAHVE